MKWLLPFILVVWVLCAIVEVDGGVTLTGVNLSGAEWGGDIPGTPNKNYVWNSPSDAEYFVEKGMNVFRVNFLWERMQPIPGGPLAPDYLQGLQTLVSFLSNNSRYTLLDAHNYGRGFGGVIGQSSTSICLFADFWYKLALEFKDNDWVIFGLMNEPHDQSVYVWKNAAQTAIDAIRFTGATNMITVPGIDWTGAWSWGNNNAPVMIDITDPINNFVFEVHQYEDVDGSGTHTTCVNSTIGSVRLEYFTQWARENKQRGWLGEFGVGPNEICEEALADMTTYMDNNDDVWFAWTYWAGGPWWGDYFSDISPNSTGTDKPQMAYLEPHFPKSTPKPSSFPTPSGSYTPPAEFAKYMTVYQDGKLQSPFEDYSWAPHSLICTTETMDNSTYSISVDLSHYNALWFTCDACVNNSMYFAFEFWVNPGSNGSISELVFYLINGTAKESAAVNSAVGDYLLGAASPNTWVKASLPIGWFSTSIQHSGLQLAGSSSGAVGEMYFDQLQFVAYEDNYSWLTHHMKMEDNIIKVAN